MHNSLTSKWLYFFGNGLAGIGATLFCAYILDLTVARISLDYVFEPNHFVHRFLKWSIAAGALLGTVSAISSRRLCSIRFQTATIAIVPLSIIGCSFFGAVLAASYTKVFPTNSESLLAPQTRVFFVEGLSIGANVGFFVGLTLASITIWLKRSSLQNLFYRLREATIGSPNKVVILAHHWFHDVIGGSFRVATEFAEHLANHSRQVIYLCCASSPSQPFIETQNNVLVVRYPTPRFPFPFVRWWLHSVRCREIVECLRDVGGVEALHAHTPLQAAGGFAVKFPASVRKVYTVHSPFDDEFLSQTRSNRLTKKIGAWFARRIENKNIKQADLIHTLSQYTLKVLQKKFGADQMQSRVEPGWIPGNSNKPGSPSRQEARKKLGRAWNFSGPIFFTLRRLENRMGIHLIVDAVEKIRREFCLRKSPSSKAESTLPEFRVIISGDGSLRKELEDKVAKLGLAQYLFFTGKLTEEERELAYQAADCFVLPTLALECFGLIVLESYAAGIPVIASNVAAIPELVRLLGEEWLFDCGNAESLAFRMKQFIDGVLVPSKSPREIAELFSRERILPEWERMLLDSKPLVSGKE